MHEIRNSVLTWWAQETCVSPNKSEVTRKKLEPDIYDKKPTHFLTKTQICLRIQICWLSLGLFSSSLMNF
jgi:hypothetical protein